MTWLKYLGPLVAAALLVLVGLYLGNIREKANSAGRLQAELTASRKVNADLMKKAAAANIARDKASARIAEMEIEIDEAFQKRAAPVVVRRVVPAGSSCLSADAVGMLNGAAVDSNRLVRAAANRTAATAE